MKSVLVSILMFMAVLGAMYTGLFGVLASPYMMIFAIICVAAALFFAFRVLGNPFTSADKDDKNDKNTD